MEKIKKIKSTTILNLLAIIIMLIPVFRDKWNNIPIQDLSNKFIFGLGAIILSVSQVIKAKRDQKEGEKLTIRHFGNAIAFGIMFLLILFFY